MWMIMTPRPVTEASRVVVIRTAIVLGTLALLPLLAIPPANRAINRLLRKEPLADQELGSRSSGERTPAPTARAGRVTAVVAGMRPTLRGMVDSDDIAEPGSSSWNPRRVAVIQQQLQHFGANYMILERTAGGEQYRFHCTIELPGSAVYQRVFEATDKEAQRAMEQVLVAVRTWRQNASR